MNGDQRGHEFDTSTGEAAGEPLAFSASTGIAPALVDSSMMRDFGFEKLSFGQVTCAPVPCAVGRPEIGVMTVCFGHAVEDDERAVRRVARVEVVLAGRHDDAASAYRTPSSSDRASPT